MRSSQVASQTRGDHGFAVVIAGSPRLYRPGQVYTVTLEGVREDEGIKVKFIDFMIVAESNLPSTEVSGLGTFQLMPGDAMTKFSHRCRDKPARLIIRLLFGLLLILNPVFVKLEQNVNKH